MVLCDYGCGQEAKYQFKNSKWCCSKSYNSCPQSKKNNSKSLIGIQKTEEHKQKMRGKRKSFTNSGSFKKGCIPWIKGKHHTEESKNKVSGKNNPMYGMIGEKNPNWNPDLTNEERQIKRNYLEYTEWRKAVYRRDNYTCQKCKDRGGITLNAHHIESYSSNKELRITLSNGVTLCKKCHNNFHHQFGYSNNIRKQFIEFIKGDKIDGTLPQL